MFYHYHLDLVASPMKTFMNSSELKLSLLQLLSIRMMILLLLQVHLQESGKLWLILITERQLG